MCVRFGQLYIYPLQPSRVSIWGPRLHGIAFFKESMTFKRKPYTFKGRPIGKSQNWQPTVGFAGSTPVDRHVQLRHLVKPPLARTCTCRTNIPEGLGTSNYIIWGGPPALSQKKPPAQIGKCPNWVSCPNGHFIWIPKRCQSLIPSQAAIPTATKNHFVQLRGV